jgi:hypothetical protein
MGTATMGLAGGDGAAPGTMGMATMGRAGGGGGTPGTMGMATIGRAGSGTLAGLRGSLAGSPSQ